MEASQMIVKICGITSIDMGLAAERAGANLIGFVFAPSSRRVTPERAADIATALSPDVQKVGVFVNESLDMIETIVRTVGLDMVQLHGDEPASLATRVSVPVIKAFTIDDVTDDTLEGYPCDYYLIDSPGTVYRGGSGNVFDWERLVRRNINRDKLILAGGLQADNV